MGGGYLQRILKSWDGEKVPYIFFSEERLHCHSPYSANAVYFFSIYNESRQKVRTGQSVPFSKYKSTFLKEKGLVLEEKGTFLEQKSIKKGPLLSKRSIFCTFFSLKKVL